MYTPTKLHGWSVTLPRQDFLAEMRTKFANQILLDSAYCTTTKGTARVHLINQMTGICRFPQVGIPRQDFASKMRTKFANQILLDSISHYIKILQKADDRNLPFPTSGSPSARFCKQNANKICEINFVGFRIPHQYKREWLYHSLLYWCG